MQTRTWLTTGEVAKELEVTRQTVSDWIKAGRIPAKRVGSRYRVERHDLSRVVTEAAA